MSQLIPFQNYRSNNQSIIQQLRSISRSFFCNNESTKCLYDSDTDNYQFIACPVLLLTEMNNNSIFSTLISDRLYSFHEKYNGCSSNTLLYLFCTFYELFDEQFSSLMDDTQTNSILESLEQLINDTSIIAQENFRQRLFASQICIKNVAYVNDIILRICRYQQIYSDSLFDVYKYFVIQQNVNNLSTLSDLFDSLNHVTIVEHSQEKCYILTGGIALPQLSTQHLQIDIKNELNRTILIDGCLSEDYSHLGYEMKMKLKQKIIMDEILSSKKSWLNLIESIIKQYNITLILCSSTIDLKLKERTCSYLKTIENIPIRILKLLSSTSLLTYLTDLDDENTNIIQTRLIQSEKINSIYLISNENEKSKLFVNIIQCVPFEKLIYIQSERFKHCLARFKQILKVNCFVNGSSKFEEKIYEYWYKFRKNNQQINSIEYKLAIQYYLDCLDFYIKYIKSLPFYVPSIIDDFYSKMDAWKICIQLLKIIIKIDYVAKTDHINYDI